jgi:hypothetical protein
VDKKESFWVIAGKKLVENMLSVKVWVIFSLLGVSTKLVLMSLMSADVWAAVNGGVISTVFAMREAFKVAKVKSDDDSSNMMV